MLDLYTKNMLVGIEEWESSSESQKRMKILEEHNQTTFTIAPGMVGCLDEDNLYIGEDSNQGGDLRPIKLSDLKMTKSGDEPQTEEEKALISDFIFLNSPESKKIIKKDIGIKLSTLSLPEQVSFLQFLYNRTESQAKELKSFTEVHGSNGFKAFLSLEHGGLEMGDKILSISESLKNQPEIADQLFAQYAEMVDSVEKSAEEATELYNEIFYDKYANKDEVANGILKRAYELLFEANKRLGIESLSPADKKILLMI